jgi:hypothetical protein
VGEIENDYSLNKPFFSLIFVAHSFLKRGKKGKIGIVKQGTIFKELPRIVGNTQASLSFSTYCPSKYILCRFVTNN